MEDLRSETLIHIYNLNTFTCEISTNDLFFKVVKICKAINMGSTDAHGNNHTRTRTHAPPTHTRINIDIYRERETVQQGWPTSQRPRAAFFASLPKRAACGGYDVIMS